MNHQKALAASIDIESYLNNKKLTYLNLENNDFTTKLNTCDIQRNIYTHPPPNISVDNDSCLLLPENFKNLICGEATRDGNFFEKKIFFPCGKIIMVIRY